MSKFLYHLGNSLYFLVIKLLSPFHSKAYQWVLGRKNWEHKLQQINQNNNDVVWMHCASLGEFEQGRPVLEALKKEHPHIRTAVSFFSPSGYQVHQHNTDIDILFYLPNNTKSNAQKVVQHLRPKVVIWVKYDYWSFYLKELKRQAVPTLLVSAKFRTNQPFFKWYGSYWRAMLRNFTHCFVQDQNSVQLLQSINIAQVTLAGDTRFDRVNTIAKNSFHDSILQHFTKDKQVIILGSSWPEDDEELAHFANENQQLRFVVAPHHVNAERLQDLEQRYKYSVRYSSYTEQHQANTLIIDNIGMLSYLYRYAYICMVGGGFGGDGVHNVLEATVYGKPVIVGPENQKHKEVQDLKELGAVIEVESAIELEASITELLTDTDYYQETANAARQYTLQHQGSTKLILAYITQLRLLSK
jgi:3-deoxy-D-manno-octulosonic-acid transferase